MNRTLEGSYEECVRSVILPDAVHGVELATQGQAAMGTQARPAIPLPRPSTPVLIEDFRDRPTIPMHG
jgi:hypothetical protein